MDRSRPPMPPAGWRRTLWPPGLAGKLRGSAGLRHRRGPAPSPSCVDTFGTGNGARRTSSPTLCEQVFDLRPAAIIRDLGLRRPIYRQLAAHGHMGREELGGEWDNTDRVEALKAAVAEL